MAFGFEHLHLAGGVGTGLFFRKCAEQVHQFLPERGRLLLLDHQVLQALQLALQGRFTLIELPQQRCQLRLQVADELYALGDGITGIIQVFLGQPVLALQCLEYLSLVDLGPFPEQDSQGLNNGRLTGVGFTIEGDGERIPLRMTFQLVDTLIQVFLNACEQLPNRGLQLRDLSVIGNAAQCIQNALHLARDIRVDVHWRLKVDTHWKIHLQVLIREKSPAAVSQRCVDPTSETGFLPPRTKDRATCHNVQTASGNV